MLALVWVSRLQCCQRTAYIKCWRIFYRFKRPNSVPFTLAFPVHRLLSFIVLHHIRFGRLIVPSCSCLSVDSLGIWLTRFIEGISAWLALTPAGWWLLLRDFVPGELSVSASFPMSPPGSGLSPYQVVFLTPLGEARGGFLPRFPDNSIIFAWQPLVNTQTRHGTI